MKLGPVWSTHWKTLPLVWANNSRWITRRCIATNPRYHVWMYTGYRRPMSDSVKDEQVAVSLENAFICLPGKDTNNSVSTCMAAVLVSGFATVLHFVWVQTSPARSSNCAKLSCAIVRNYSCTISWLHKPFAIQSKTVVEDPLSMVSFFIIFFNPPFYTS